MALTDKSAIALNVHDLRVVEGEPRFNDGRLALRLDLDRRWWRQLIQRHEAGAQERGLGPLLYGATKYTGGRPSQDWFLTVEQTIYFVAQTETKNTLDVIAEVAKVVGALRRGAPIPDTPWTDALLAPDKPTVTRGDNNIVRVKHEEPLGDLFTASPDDAAKVKPPAHPNAHNAYKRDTWVEEEDGYRYPIIKERDYKGDVADIFFERMPALQTSTNGYQMLLPWINGSTVTLHLNHIIPMAVVKRVYLNQLPDGKVKDTARATLYHFVAV